MSSIEQKTAERASQAEVALHEVHIISSIILRLAKCAVDQDEKIEGQELLWLATQLDKAADGTAI